jgi:hypothetical protein
MKSYAVLLPPTQDGNNSLVLHVHTAYTTHLLVTLHTSCLMFWQSLFYLIMVPKHKISDTGNLDMTKKSCKELPLSEKVKVLHLSIKEKNVCRSCLDLW